MMDKIINYILIAMFSSVILFFCVNNIDACKSTIAEKKNYTSIHLYLKNFDQIYKKNFYKRKKLIDIYGLSLLLLNKNTVLNFDMIKSNGFVVLSEKHIKLNDDVINKIVNKVLTISAIAQEHQIPFVYIQPPSDRNKVSPEVASLLQMKQGIIFNNIKNALSGTNVYYIDIFDILNKDNIPLEKIFFKTDVHNTTFTEWKTAYEIVECLKDIGISYKEEEIEEVFNILNYEIIKNDFYGNTIRSVGDYFTKKDIFETFIPKFHTSMSFYSDNIQRKGSFQEVAMNGYEKLQRERLYYVTNYGQYQRSVYTYENFKVNNNNKLLIICDSFVMRTFSFLSLINKKVTVYDPRFNKSDETLKKILESEKYDAILFSTGTLGLLFANNYGLKGLYENNKVINININKSK